MSRRFPGLVLSALLVLGLVVVTPVAAAEVERSVADVPAASSDDCPLELDDHGFADDVRWVVGIAGCPNHPTTFYMWIILPTGEAADVYEAVDGPIPVRWSRSGSVGRVHLTHPPLGETDPWVDVALDALGLPIAPVLMRDWRRATP